jgi:hypothetical protein
VNLFGIYVFGLIAMSEKARELEAADPVTAPMGAQAANTGDIPAQDSTETARHYPILARPGQKPPFEETPPDQSRYPLLTGPAR